MRSETELVQFKREQYDKEHPPKTYPPRIAGLDPGRQRDSFAMVGIEIHNKRDIHIIGAQEWKYTAYSTTEEQIEVISRTVVKRPFRHIVVETNNSGWHVVENLKKRGLPILAVNTVGKVTDKKKLALGKSMYKNDTVQWVQRVIQNTEMNKPNVPHLYFPKQQSEGTTRLWNQLPKFTRKINQSGGVSYSAQGTEHDDLVMALILACHIARIRYIQRETRFTAVTSNYSKKLGKERKKPEDFVPEVLANPYNRITGFSVQF